MKLPLVGLKINGHHQIVIFGIHRATKVHLSGRVKDEAGKALLKKQLGELGSSNLTKLDLKTGALKSKKNKKKKIKKKKKKKKKIKKKKKKKKKKKNRKNRKHQRRRQYEI